MPEFSSSWTTPVPTDSSRHGLSAASIFAITRTSTLWSATTAARPFGLATASACAWWKRRPSPVPFDLSFYPKVALAAASGVILLHVVEKATGSAHLRARAEPCARTAGSHVDRILRRKRSNVGGRDTSPAQRASGDGSRLSPSLPEMRQRTSLRRLSQGGGPLRRLRGG